jgi:hypothetical protein
MCCCRWNGGFYELANFVAGKLDIEVLSKPHLIHSKVLNHGNDSTVARFVSDGLKVLRHTRSTRWECVNFVFSCCSIYAESCNCFERVLP